MTTKKDSGAEHVDYVNEINDEKGAARQHSVYDEEILKEKAQLGDYSGAKEKTDPAEIKLVRKLDMYIMPT